MSDESAGAAEPRHLNNHHRDTLGALFAHPMGHNIRWVDVVSLAEAVGTVEEKRDGKFRIQIGDEVEVFDRPKVKDIDTQQIVDLRRMLHNAGYRPPPPGEEL